MTDRGQTTLDFATGAGVFLLAVAFVFAFVPGMFQPFDGGGDGTLVADRAASTLAADLLADPGEPYVLNETCTHAFFDPGASRPDGCRYVANASDLNHALAIGTTRRTNVTIERGERIEYHGGAPVPTRSDVVTAQRAVLVDGEVHRLHVRVW